MRVVVDTNVLVSGVFFGGVPGRILDAWRDGKLTIVVSPAILDEYHRVGRVLASRYEGVDIEPILALVTLHGEVVEAVKVEIGPGQAPSISVGVRGVAFKTVGVLGEDLVAGRRESARPTVDDVDGAGVHDRNLAFDVLEQARHRQVVESVVVEVA